MNRYFARAFEEPLKREFFFSRFGHRGPGELDLSHPRWEELGESAFGGGKNKESVAHADIDVESEIHDLKTFKDSVLVEEWRLLKELLELREQWKMEILRPYAHIRYLSLELARRTSMGNDIFHLTVEEVEGLVEGKQSTLSLKQIVRERKEKLNSFKGIYLSDILEKKEVGENLLKTDLTGITLRGTPLSHGIVKGTVCVVNDPAEVDFSNWPQDAILVAPATDPGWTALFTRSKGVIVERGGVLSHCAILARELGLPSINLTRASQILKNGDRIWLDGDHGGVKHDNA
jgi:phosphohistidine swiveling domain-containing protein